MYAHWLSAISADNSAGCFRAKETSGFAAERAKIGSSEIRLVHAYNARNYIGGAGTSGFPVARAFIASFFSPLKIIGALAEDYLSRGHTDYRLNKGVSGEIRLIKLLASPPPRSLRPPFLLRLVPSRPVGRRHAEARSVGLLCKTVRSSVVLDPTSDKYSGRRVGSDDVRSAADGRAGFRGAFQ